MKSTKNPFLVHKRDVIAARLLSKNHHQISLVCLGLVLGLRPLKIFLFQREMPLFFAD